MKVSTKGRYALRLMADLAAHDTGEWVRLKEISERQAISVKYLEQIIPLLTRAKLVKSSRGNSGGYRLTRPPQAYTAGEILRATEGDLSPIACLEDTPNQCPRHSSLLGRHEKSHQRICRRRHTGGACQASPGQPRIAGRPAGGPLLYPYVGFPCPSARAPAAFPAAANKRRIKNVKNHFHA